uniref:uncharacterized protein isoform X2 n=1 Tax=Myxine glutinosa TaxID=7769 RepID=UPI0035900C59
MRCCPPVTHSRRLLGSNMLTICMSHVACYSWRRLCRCHSMFAATSLLLASLAQLGHAKDCTFHDRNDRTLDFVCSEYEQCCGTKCCLRVISTYRIWYFWLCLLLGTLFCCGSGMWLKRRLLGTHGITAQPPLFVTRQADSGSRGRCTTIWSILLCWTSTFHRNPDAHVPLQFAATQNPGLRYGHSIHKPRSAAERVHRAHTFSQWVGVPVSTATDL